MKPKQIILQIAVPVPKRALFDYLAPIDIPKNTLILPGMRIQVSFGRRKLIGILIRTTNESAYQLDKLKPAIAILDKKPLIDLKMLALGMQISDYYQHPVGDVLMSFFPAKLRKEESFELPKELKTTTNTESPLRLNSEQLAALKYINNHSNKFNVFLLEGITGSGKTEVYLHKIQETLDAKKQVLLLLPEIGLTPQTLARFEARFAATIAVMHSRMTSKKRLTSWLQAETGLAQIIIGTRSAVFTPLPNLGLIIIDEEHDLSYKQQDSFRYHARDVAILRAKAENIPIILGSATPSLESLHNAHLLRYHHLKLTKRAGCATPPIISLTDIRKTFLEHGLATSTITEIKKHLEQGNQTMLYLNRRGFAHALLCDACGWIATCNRCEMRMTWHKSAQRLLCHHCLKSICVPNNCEKCLASPLKPAGFGTERMEENLNLMFPKAEVLRIDRDSTKNKGQMEKALFKIKTGKAKILLGTQMLAKGHHFPDITHVTILDADGGFFSADFRGPERTGQVLLQVAGRAGRANKTGKVVIQTRNPDHPLFDLLIHQGYSSFAEALLTERKLCNLPPYSYLALFRAESHMACDAMNFLNDVSSHIELNNTVTGMGPITAPMAKRAGKHRYQLLVQADKRSLLNSTLKSILSKIENLKSARKVRWSIDVDPLEMY